MMLLWDLCSNCVVMSGSFGCIDTRFKQYSILVKWYSTQVSKSPRTCCVGQLRRRHTKSPRCEYKLLDCAVVACMTVICP